MSASSPLPSSTCRLQPLATIPARLPTSVRVPDRRKKELVTLLRAHSIHAATSWKKEDLALELMKKAKHGQQQSAAKPAAAEKAPGCARAAAQSPAAGLSGFAQLQVGGPAAAPCSQRELFSQTEAHHSRVQTSEMDLATTEHAAPAQPTGATSVPAAARIPEPSAPPTRAVMQLDAEERGMLQELRGRAARSPRWPDYSALWLDFSLLPRAGRSRDDVPSVAQGPSASQRGGFAAPAQCPAALQRSGSAVTPARSPTQEIEAAQQTMIAKLCKVIRGVGEQQASSALRAAEWNLNRASAHRRVEPLVPACHCGPVHSHS